MSLTETGARRPLLLLDVDGVLNAIPARRGLPGYRVERIDGGNRQGGQREERGGDDHQGWWRLPGVAQ